MAERHDSSKSRQIEVLLSVLGTGIFAGILIALAMLYYYNPTGSYQISNILLDPENAFTLRYTEPGAKGKSEGRYVFNSMEYSYYNPESKKTDSIATPKEKYAKFYQSIANDKSIPEAGPEIESMFNSQNQSNLVLKVRQVGEDASKGHESTFSRIVFADNGDYYRVQLRQSNAAVDWIYFQHPKISKEAFRIFKSHD